MVDWRNCWSSQNFMYSSSTKLTCWEHFPLVLHCRGVLVEKGPFLHTLLCLCANPGLKISQSITMETAVLFVDNSFKRDVALKSSLVLHIMNKPTENIPNIMKTLFRVFCKFSMRCQLVFEGVKLWLLMQVKVWKVILLYQACNVKLRDGYIYVFKGSWVLHLRAKKQPGQNPYRLSLLICSMDAVVIYCLMSVNI